MSESSTRVEIMEAAQRVASMTGFGRLRMGDVAAEASVSRQTVYRHFPDKAALLHDVVTHEALKIVDEVFAADEASTLAPADALARTFGQALGAVRDHALFRRVLEIEPEGLLPILTDIDGPAGTITLDVAGRILDVHLPDMPSAQRHALAEVFARLLISHAVSPSKADPQTVASAVVDLLALPTSLDARPDPGDDPR